MAKKTPNICPPDNPRELAILTGRKKMRIAMSKIIKDNQKFSGALFQISCRRELIFSKLIFSPKFLNSFIGHIYSESKEIKYMTPCRSIITSIFIIFKLLLPLFRKLKINVKLYKVLLRLAQQVLLLLAT